MSTASSTRAPTPRYQSFLPVLSILILLLAIIRIAGEGSSASASPTKTSVSIVNGTVGRKIFPGWTVGAVNKTRGDELAVTSATSGDRKSRVGFFAFASKTEAHAFVEKPPNSAVIPIGGSSAIWEYASQEGFTSSKLNNESVVYDALSGDAVAIFLQQGEVVVVGEYQGTADKTAMGYNLDALGLSAVTQAAAEVLSNKPVQEMEGFKGIVGKALPGLPSSNWPKLSPGTPLVGTAEETTSSIDLAYEVDIFDFSTAGGATASYKSANTSLFNNVEPLGAAMTPLAGGTGVSGSSEGFNLIECGGSSSVQAGNKCSGNNSKPFSVGVVTVFERGTTVTAILYFAPSPQALPSPGELLKNIKVARSVISLLSSVGVS